MAFVRTIAAVQADLQQVQHEVNQIQTKIDNADEELKNEKVPLERRLQLLEPLLQEKNKLRDEKKVLLDKLNQRMFILVCFDTGSSMAHSNPLLCFFFAPMISAAVLARFSPAFPLCSGSGSKSCCSRRCVFWPSASIVLLSCACRFPSCSSVIAICAEL